MKNITTSLILFALTIFLSEVGFGQATGCYVMKQEASGYDVASKQAELNAKACELLSVLPDSTYSDSFKVFSFGFYMGMELYSTYSYPQAFLDMQAQVAQESPYFLLIGRQSDLTGIFTRFWVDVKLPDAGHFPCITPQKTAEVRQLVKYVIEKEYGEHGNYHGSYAEAETAGIEKFNQLIDKLINCCQSNKPEKMSGICEVTEEDVEDTFNGSGFFNYDGLPVQLDFDNNGNIVNLSFTLNEQCGLHKNLSNFNLTQEIANFKNELDAIGATHDIEIIHVNLADVNLNSISFPENPSVDYYERIYVTTFGGKTKVYFKFSFAHSPNFAFFNNFGPGGNAGEKSLGISSFAKTAVRWFFKRAGTNPSIVFIGVAVDYITTTCVEYWFNQDCHDDFITAFVYVIKERG